MGKRKTWTEKLHDSKDFPRVQPIEPHQEKRWGKGTILIATPLEVDGLMRQIPPGKVTTINEIRECLARGHGATMACPITTGIFASIAAHAAEEAAQREDAEITPYWRTLKAGGRINPKYPGGTEGQKRKLEAEGHRVIQRGKTCRVEDYESKLAQLSFKPAADRPPGGSPF